MASPFSETPESDTDTGRTGGSTSCGVPVALNDSSGYRAPQVRLAGRSSGALAIVSVPPEAMGTELRATIDRGGGIQHDPGVGSGPSLTVTAPPGVNPVGRRPISVTLSDAVDGTVPARAGGCGLTERATESRGMAEIARSRNRWLCRGKTPGDAVSRTIDSARPAFPESSASFRRGRSHPRTHRPTHRLTRSGSLPRVGEPERDSRRRARSRRTRTTTGTSGPLPDSIQSSDRPGPIRRSARCHGKRSRT
jgi:hypothetical protein